MNNIAKTKKSTSQPQYENGYLYELNNPDISLLIFCKTAHSTHSKFLVVYHQDEENRIQRIEKFISHLPATPLVNTKTTHEQLLNTLKEEYFQLRDCKPFLNYKFSWLEELQALFWHKKNNLPINEKNLNLFFNELRLFINKIN